MKPDSKTYEELVLEKGFPYGPQGHNSMYYYLKQRQIRRLVRENKTNHYDRIGLVTGIRISESTRRMHNTQLVQYVRRSGAEFWLNPILDFNDKDKNAYIKKYNLPRNEVVDLIHKSGECLCGALANRDREFADIKSWFPKDIEAIERLEVITESKGMRDCRWATRIRSDKQRDKAIVDLPLCQTCQIDFDIN
jgi:3'-phosphoadenosine 5'-phosphosulfate sulfotransferase (PAPS reductase)/FAD synthetase